MADEYTLRGEPFEPPAATTTGRGETWRRRASSRLATMHQRYGRGLEGRPCRGCAFLIHGGGSDRKSFLKCQKAGVSHSEATDWRAKWASCGAYEARSGGERR